VPPIEMPGTSEALLRLVLAFVFSAAIGLERERPGRPAGLRTHMLVCMAACLLMMVSVGVAGDRMASDPGRIAAQVVTGMGFLGAGTIIRYGSSIRGLTTAASLWATSAIGLAIGVGWYAGALITTVGVFLTLTVVQILETRVVRPRGFERLAITFPDADVDLGAVTAKLAKLGVELSKIELSRPVQGEERVVNILVRPPGEMDPDALAQEIAALDAVSRAEAL
jgi:putative Mg2+ transporter-C (MgtC) family protein